jgi:hypothetical protein
MGARKYLVSCIQALRRPVAMFAVTSLLLGAAACDRRNGSAGDGTTVPTEPPTVSYEVPDVIDAAYVETVMRALDHIYGEAVRIMARERTMSDAFLQRLVAIYTDKEFKIAQDIWLRDLAEGLKDLRPSPGDPVTTVTRLVRSSSGCIVAAVVRDFSATTTGSTVVTPQQYIGLIKKRDGFDPLRLNPTPWIISFDGFIQSGAEPERPCLDD